MGIEGKKKHKRRETGKRKKDRRRVRRERQRAEHNRWKAELMRKSEPIVEIHE